MHASKSRRLRKKLYLDEFSVLGFELSFDFVSDENFNSFLAELIDLIESRELILGGGGLKPFNAFIFSEYRYKSATYGDRNAVKDWLVENDSVENIIINPLVDANYGT
ncbi:MAG: hypothetical protein ACJAS1_006525 [Oleiphilaceae bacterium]|jgi:uncharacterized protein YggL (DUF469 family)